MSITTLDSGMSREVMASSSAASFDYEILDKDSDVPKTAAVSTNRTNPWIEPETLKLQHRIGRGPFGDVWLATLHQSTEDYDEHHEVAAKMLHPIKEDHVKIVLEKFNELYLKCQGVSSVCWIHGISMLNGRICIIMKLYEGSIGDKLARLRDGWISLHDVLRYGIDLAQGILELHAKGILVLNLKPCNVLLNDNNQAILGDVGIPNLLLGSSFVSSDIAQRLGSPNFFTLTVQVLSPSQSEPSPSFIHRPSSLSRTLISLLRCEPLYQNPIAEPLHVSRKPHRLSLFLFFPYHNLCHALNLSLSPRL